MSKLMENNFLKFVLMIMVVVISMRCNDDPGPSDEPLFGNGVFVVNEAIIQKVTVL